MTIMKNELIQSKKEYMSGIRSLIQLHKLEPYFDSGTRERVYHSWEYEIREKLIEVLDAEFDKVHLEERLILLKRDKETLTARLDLLGGDD